MAAATPAPLAARLSGPLVALILVVAAAIVLVGCYLLLPQNGHFLGTVLMGVFAIVFAAAAYLTGSLSRGDPTVQRYTAWGFFAFGIALLLVTFAIPLPSYNLALTWQLVGLVLTLLVLAGTVAGVGWRSRTKAATPPREEKRAEWRDRPTVSAFDYASARAPDAPATASPPSSPPSRGPGA